MPLDDLLIKMTARPDPPRAFRVGQTVRIRSTITSNVHAIGEMLGKLGTVEAVSVSMIFKRVYYDVRIGERVEPFEEHELDARYIRNSEFAHA